MAGAPWFRTEQTGWAAQPANWKGWAALGAWLLGIAVWGLLMFVVVANAALALIFFVVGILVLTGILVAVAINKTEGHWAWQNKNTDSGGQ